MLQRVTLDQDPYLALDAGKDWYQRGAWPCRWITVSKEYTPPFAAAYRLCFHLEEAAVIRAHVSADERYELFVDGQNAARGSERGEPKHWFYESYDLALPPGDHVLVARVWSLGELSPWAQMSTHHGFLFAVEGDWIPRLASGVAPWEAKILPGYTFTDPAPTLAAGANLVVDGKAFAWGFERGLGDGWRPAIPHYPGMRPERAEAFDLTGRVSLPPYHELLPARLPQMIQQPVPPAAVRYIAAYDSLRALPPAPEDGGAIEGVVPVRLASHLAEEAPAWAAMLRGASPVTLPAHTHRRILLDLEDYYCAYPRVRVSGGAGAALRLVWAEALYNEPAAQSKGQRDEIEGKYFYGASDVFLPDGAPSRCFETLWWQCGRYLEIRVETQDQPLTIERLELTETRYPLELQASFQASDPRLARTIPILMRGLQMCAHETYFDCPYYEQLMYVGDTRLEALVTYTVTPDSRLPHKALELFNQSRTVNGLTQSRYPSHARQTIPPFSLWYVGMVYDHALWRGERPFIRALMPGVRGILDAFLSYRNPQGLVAGPPGWNFMDWSQGWESGIPPQGDFGASGPINWLTVLALGWAAQLETWLDEPELAARWERLAAGLAGDICAAFWDPALSRFSDVPGQACASEHAQALAILSGRLTAGQRAGALDALLHHPDLTRATIYMRHYLFEAFRLLERPDAILAGLELWFGLEATGLKTTPEMPEPTRSDCHGWGATPLYHYLASLLGIRPANFGFEQVLIQPLPGPLTHIRGQMPHPKGMIEVDLRQEHGRLSGQVCLPGGLSGRFKHGAMEIALHEGQQTI